MKKTLLPLMAVILVTLNSCGTFKKSLTKNKVKEKTTTETNTAATFTTALTRTITEILDTNVVIKKDSVTATGDQITIDAGDTLRSENDNLIVETWKDPRTKKIKSKATRKQSSVPVSISKKTVEALNQGATFNQKIKTDTNKLTKNKEVQTSAKSGYGVYIFWILVLLFLLLIAWYLGRRLGFW